MAEKGSRHGVCGRHGVGRVLLGWIAGCTLLGGGVAWGAHPLLTDDTGTQGAGRWQLELQADWLRADRTGVPAGSAVERRRKVDLFATVLSYGIADDVDVQFGLARLKQHESQNGVVTNDVGGMGDATVEVKWRLWDADGFSIAMKPGLVLPTGDETRGLGTGRTSWGVTAIVAQEAGAWSFLGNLAYSRARFGLPQLAADARSELWRASAGVTYAAASRIRIVGEVGVRTNESRNDPFPLDGNSRFGTIGLIYSLGKNVDLDAGFRRRLNRAEFDKAFLAGATVRW